jgi:hypothetical protein
MSDTFSLGKERNEQSPPHCKGKNKLFAKLFSKKLKP